MLDRLWSYITHDLKPGELSALIRVGFRSLFVVHIAFACGWLTSLGLSGFAKAEEISGVTGKVEQLSDEFEKYRAQERVNALELELKDLDKEIFAIEARLAEIGRLGQQADALYNQRLATLRSNKARVERELALAMRHPALQDPNG